MSNNAIGIQAALQSCVLIAVKHAPEPPTINDLLHRTDVKAMKATKVQLWAALTNMSKTGELRRIRIDRRSKGDPARYAYELGDGSQMPVKKSIVSKDVALPAADLKIDVLKKTGKIRVTFKGSVIEIGVLAE